MLINNINIWHTYAFVCMCAYIFRLSEFHKFRMLGWLAVALDRCNMWQESANAFTLKVISILQTPILFILFSVSKIFLFSRFNLRIYCLVSFTDVCQSKSQLLKLTMV